MKFSTGTKFLVLLLSGVLVGQTKINLATQTKGVLPVANGGMGAAPTASDQMPVSTAPNVWTFPSIPMCASDGLHSLTYSTSTHTFSCTANSGAPTGNQYYIPAFNGAGSGSNYALGQAGLSTDSTGKNLTVPSVLLAGEVNSIFNADLNGGTTAFAASSNCVTGQCTITIPSTSTDTYPAQAGTSTLGILGKAARIIDNRKGLLTDYVEDPNSEYAHTYTVRNFHRLFTGQDPAWPGATLSNPTGIYVGTYDQAPGSYQYGQEDGLRGLLLQCDSRALGINECLSSAATMYGSGDKVWQYIYWWYAGCGYGNGDDERCEFLGHQSRETDGYLPTGTVNTVNPNGGTNDYFLDNVNHLGDMGSNRRLMEVKNATGGDASVISGCTISALTPGAGGGSSGAMPTATVTGCTLPVSTAIGQVDSGSLPISTPRNLQSPLPMTFTVDVSSGTFTNASPICIGDVHRVETISVANITSIGSLTSGKQTFSVNLRDQFTGGDGGGPVQLFQGGLCGTQGREVAGILSNGASTNSQWVASHAYTLGQQIVDAQHHIEQITTAGTSGAGPYPPTFNHGSTTTDNTAGWTDEGFVVGPLSVSFAIMGSTSSTSFTYDIPDGYEYHQLSEYYPYALPLVLNATFTRSSNVVTATTNSTIALTPGVVVASTADPSFNGTFTPQAATSSQPVNTYASTWSQTGSNVTSPVNGTITIGGGLQGVDIYPAAEVINMTAPAFTSDSHTYTPGSYVQLEAPTSWPIGATVEESFGGMGMRYEADSQFASMPNTVGKVFSCQGLSCTGAQPGTLPSYFFQQFQNENLSIYSFEGGRYSLPDMVDVSGPMGIYFNLENQISGGGVWVGAAPGSIFINDQCGYGAPGTDSCSRPDGQWLPLHSNTQHYPNMGGANIMVDKYNDMMKLWVGYGGGGAGLNLGYNYTEQEGGNAYYNVSTFYLGRDHTGPVTGGTPTLDVVDGFHDHASYGAGAFQTYTDLGGSGEMYFNAAGRIRLFGQNITYGHCLFLSSTYSGATNILMTGDMSNNFAVGSGCVSGVLGSTANGFVVTSSQGSGSASDQYTIGVAIDASHYLPTTADHTTWNNAALLGGTITTSNAALGAGAGTGAAVTSAIGIDSTHQIIITTGTAPTASATLYTFTYTTAKNHTSYCTMNQIGGPASDAYISLTASTTQYIVSVGSTALAASTGYTFNITCP